MAKQTDISPGITKSHIPVRVPRNFHGRDAELTQLKSALLTPPHRVALVGAHGVGKTILASAYAAQEFDKFRIVAWINAQSQASLLDGLLAVGARLGLNAGEKAPSEAIANVLGELGTDGQGTLLVYDNAADPADLYKWLPGGNDVYIIITSNALHWKSEATPIRIDPWSPEIAASFLASRMATDREALDALNLARDVGGFPIALEMAAAYCERHSMGLAEYRTRLLREPLPQFAASERLVPAYQRSLVASITTAIDAAAQICPEAPRVLHALSHLAPDPIPMALFARATDIGSSPKKGMPLLVLVEACRVLRSLSLITTASQTGAFDDDIALHPLVRLTARASAQAASLEDAVCLLLQVYPDYETDDESGIRAYRRLAPHVVELRRSSDQRATLEMAELFLRHARYLIDDTKVRQALPFVTSARKHIRKVQGDQSSHYVNALAVTGRLLFEHGRLADAQHCLQRAYELSMSAFGENDVQTLNIMSDIAYLHGLQSARHVESHSIFCTVLAHQRRLFPLGHRCLAVTLCRLAVISWGLGYLREARELTHEAVKMSERFLPAGHRLFEIVYRCAGDSASICDDDNEGAAVWFKKSLDIALANYVSPHPIVADVAIRLAETYVVLNDDAWAIAIDLAIKESEGSHYHIAEWHRVIALHHYAEGFNLTALTFLEVALDMHEKRNDKAACVFLKAAILREMGNNEKADQLMEDFPELPQRA